jgi:hypothetical protein
VLKISALAVKRPKKALVEEEATATPASLTFSGGSP